MQNPLRKLINNKRGLTLIEILAAITISTIIIGLAFSVLLNSMNAYKKTESKQLIQQEANLIVTQLRSIHRTQSSYVITYNSTNNQYKVILTDGTFQILGNSKYQIEIMLDNIAVTDTTAQLIDTTRNEYQLLLHINDPITNNDFSLETGLTRL